MKISRLIIISFLLILTAVLLSGCSGGALATSWPGLLVDQNTGYLADNAFVYAVNLENGSLKWKYPADKAEKGKFFYAPPVMTEDGQLIVGGYDHVLYSLDKNTGAVLWTFPTAGGTGAKDRYIASPLVTAQGIFAPNADGYSVGAHIFIATNCGTVSCTNTGVTGFATTPEPATVLLVGTLLSGLGFFGRKKFIDTLKR